MKSWVSGLLLTLLTALPLLVSGQYNLLGSARAASEPGCYQLTQRERYQTSAVWYTRKIDLRESFDIEFTLNFDNDDLGADGIMFVMQTAGPNALGKTGQGMGFTGFAPSLGVEFDTYFNNDENDPLHDHVAIVRDGLVNHNSRYNIAGPIEALPNRGNLENGQDYIVRLVWRASSKQFRVYLNCRQLFDIRLDLIREIFNNSPEVYWGFTSGTGYFYANNVACLTGEVVVKDTFNICQGEAVTLVSRPAIDNRYDWTPPNLLSNANSRTPSTQPQNSQLFEVRYRDRCNVNSHDSVYVNVSQPPALELGPDQKECTDQPIVLRAEGVQGIANPQYRWSTGATTPTISVSQSGRYSLEVINGACRVKDSLRVDVAGLPVVDSVSAQPICLRDAPLTLRVPTNEANLTYRWAQSGETTQQVTVQRAGRYEVAISNAAGCSVQRVFNVSDDCSPIVYLPDAFTPNGDGVNDVLEPLGAESLQVELTVYNRWGHALFHSTDALREPWDGSFKGAPCPVGAYSYVLRYQSHAQGTATELVKRGNILLIR